MKAHPHPSVTCSRLLRLPRPASDTSCNIGAQYGYFRDSLVDAGYGIYKLRISFPLFCLGFVNRFFVFGQHLSFRLP